MEIQDDIVLFFPDFPEKSERICQALVLLEDYGFIEVRMSLDKFFVRLFHDIGDKSVGKILPQGG